MPDDSIWPPKPTLPDPSAEYDELIEARLPTLSAMTVNYELVLPEQFKLLPGFYFLFFQMRRLSPGVPLNDRVLLIQVLREEEGLDFWRAQAIVRSYYQRRGMPMTTKDGLKTFMFPLVTIVLALVSMLLGIFAFYLSFHRDTILSQPNHGASIIALDNAKSLLRIVSFSLLALIYASFFVRYLVMRRRSKRPRVETRG